MVDILFLYCTLSIIINVYFVNIAFGIGLSLYFISKYVTPFYFKNLSLL